MSKDLEYWQQRYVEQNARIAQLESIVKALTEQVATAEFFNDKLCELLKEQNPDAAEQVRKEMIDAEGEGPWAYDE